MRLHDFVRDAVRFGWSGAFYDQKASDVLRAGIGYCNTESTLFVALLRAAGIPSRQHFVDIDARILRGFIDPGTRHVDHSYTEVQVDGRWLRVDSYIVDSHLMRAAQARLVAEGELLGYGAHRNGPHWDAVGDAFSQFVNDGTVAGFTTHDHGVFEDVGAFYAARKEVNRLNPFVRAVFPFFSWSANRSVEAVRRSGSTAATEPR